MRKIEQAMVNAIARHENFSKGNTSVFRLKNGVTQVFLHGNHIATVYDTVEANMDTFRAYPTATTRSRLNALFMTFDSGKRARISKGIPIIEGGLICTIIMNGRVKLLMKTLSALMTLRQNAKVHS